VWGRGVNISSSTFMYSTIVCGWKFVIAWTNVSGRWNTYFVYLNTQQILENYYIKLWNTTYIN
jgi:hypothetical protein